MWDFILKLLSGAGQAAPGVAEEAASLGIGGVGQAATAAAPAAAGFGAKDLLALLPFLTQGAQLGQTLAAPTAPRFGGSPADRFGRMTPGVGADPGRFRNMMANRQTQGLYTGGTATPESLAAVSGGEYDEETVRRFMSGQGR